MAESGEISPKLPIIVWLLGAVSCIWCAMEKTFKYFLRQFRIEPPDRA